MTDIAALLAELDYLLDKDGGVARTNFAIKVANAYPALRAEIERLSKENAYLKAGIKWRSP